MEESAVRRVAASLYAAFSEVSIESNKVVRAPRNQVLTRTTQYNVCRCDYR